MTPVYIPDATKESLTATLEHAIERACAEVLAERQVMKESLRHCREIIADWSPKMDRAERVEKALRELRDCLDITSVAMTENRERTIQALREANAALEEGV